MPWSKDNYPVSMKNLPPEVRQKAIEIANEVLAQDHDDGKAIRVGISRAKAWAKRHRAKPTTRHRLKSLSS